MVSLNIDPSRLDSDMATKMKVARRMLSLLELASDLGGASRACKVMGYHRQQFYEIRRYLQTYRRGPDRPCAVSKRQLSLPVRRSHSGASADRGERWPS